MTPDTPTPESIAKKIVFGLTYKGMSLAQIADEAEEAIREYGDRRVREDRQLLIARLERVVKGGA